MNPESADLMSALERVAQAMDGEVDAVRSGQPDELAAAADRKRIVLAQAEPILQRSRQAISAAAPGDQTRLVQATRRMQAAAQRNAAILQGALEGLRRLYACFAEAQVAASSGTYRPDGSRHYVEEGVGTIRRSA